MKKKPNVLFIARNIPVPGIKENDILLRIAKSLNKTLNISIWFPKEIIIKLPFNNNQKIKALGNLPKIFNYRGLKMSTIDYLRLPTLKFSYLLVKYFYLFNKRVILSCNQYNVIHAHNVMPDGRMGLYLKDNLKVPLVVTIRNGDIDKMKKLSSSAKLYKEYVSVILKADQVIVHNHSSEEWLKDIRSDYIKIPHGIDELSEINKNPTKNNTVLCVANFIKRKNIDWVINAFNHSENDCWNLKIIGDGVEYKAIKELAKGNTNIHLLGKLTHEKVLYEMSRSSIFLLPSDRETFGLVYLEAAINQCAIIGRKGTGIYGWFDEGKDALFVESEMDLSKKLNKLIKDPHLIKKLQNNSYKKVIDNFLWKDQIKKYLNIYKQLDDSRDFRNIN